MKKRFRGLFALLLAMIMVIPSIAQAASEYEINEDNFEESLFKNVTHLGDDVICSYITVPTINHFEAGDSFTEKSGYIEIKTREENVNIYDTIRLSPDDIDDTLTVEFYLWKQGLKTYETENGLNYTNVVAGTPNKVSGEDIVYKVDKQSIFLSEDFSNDCGVFHYEYCIPAVIETYLQPNYTVPQGLTGKCGQTLADIELPEETTTFNDGITPIGVWSWENKTTELTEEGTMTAKAIFTAYKPDDIQPFALPDNNTPAPQLSVNPLFEHYIAGKTFPVYVKINVTADVPANPTADDYDKDKDGHYLICGSCDNEVGRQPHTYDDGTVIKEATADADGEKTFVCTVCGYSYTEVIKFETSSSEDKDTPDKDDTPADDTGKDDSSTKDDTNKDNSSTDKDSSKDESSDKDSNPTENAPSAPQNPANTGDAMNIALIAIAMIMALGCVIAVRKKEN